MKDTMIHFTAKLRFATGEVVWALLASHSPQEESPVDYEGAAHLLPSRLEHASPMTIERMFRQFARELGAVPTFSCGHASALSAARFGG